MTIRGQPYISVIIESLVVILSLYTLGLWFSGAARESEEKLREFFF